MLACLCVTAPFFLLLRGWLAGFGCILGWVCVFVYLHLVYICKCLCPCAMRIVMKSISFTTGGLESGLLIDTQQVLNKYVFTSLCVQVSRCEHERLLVVLLCPYGLLYSLTKYSQAIREPPATLCLFSLLIPLSLTNTLPLIPILHSHICCFQLNLEQFLYDLSQCSVLQEAFPAPRMHPRTLAPQATP